ncbi:hypothetical protein FA04_17175 [Ensifer adhaerens]|nr:hypothetical protein FA04_17175 [Ensifer adhaerens]
MHLLRRAIRREPFQRADIVLVHAEDEVEITEICRSHLASAQRRNIEAVPPRRLYRSPVRRIADMPGAGSGRIDLQR